MERLADDGQEGTRVLGEGDGLLDTVFEQFALVFGQRHGDDAFFQAELTKRMSSSPATLPAIGDSIYAIVLSPELRSSANGGGALSGYHNSFTFGGLNLRYTSFAEYSAA